MNRERKIAKVVGVLILVAYSMLLSTSVSPVGGLFTEVVSGAAVIGIAILMYPFFESYKLRVPYLLLKVVEGLLMFAAGFFILSQNMAMYDNLYAIHVYAFSISAFLFYILLCKTKLIAKFISIWGMIAAIFVLAANIYTQLGFELSIIGMILGYAPIILNEAFLAVWLMVKGFNVEKTSGENVQEKSISIKDIPRKLYHIVPVDIFEKYADSDGNYDPRNKEDFGKNAPYVHTVPSVEQINQNLGYLKRLKDEEFYLLEIDVEKLNCPKVTYVEYEDRKYHHLWCSLNRESYSKKLVKKNADGKIEIEASIDASTDASTVIIK